MTGDCSWCHVAPLLWEQHLLPEPSVAAHPSHLLSLHPLDIPRKQMICLSFAPRTSMDKASSIKC